MNGRFLDYDLDKGEVPPEFEGPSPLRLELNTRRNRKAWNILRQQLLEERGNACEYCQSEVANNFVLHHTDYSKGDDPAYLRVACRPCHGLITMHERRGLRLELDGSLTDLPQRRIFLEQFKKV